MNRKFLARLFLDGVGAALLLFCMSYWWLGNLTHEIAGTALFLLLIVHNGFNRRWYGRLREPGGARSLFAQTATVVLLLSMLVLLVTSVLISNALSPIFSAFGGSRSGRSISLQAIGRWCWSQSISGCGGPC